MPFRAFISVDLERFSSLRSLVQDVSAASSALNAVNTRRTSYPASSR
jgi:hypothetical protein